MIVVGSRTFDSFNPLSRVAATMTPLVPAAALHFVGAFVVAVLLIFVVGPLCVIALVHFGHVGRIVGGLISPLHKLVRCGKCGYYNLLISNEASCSECENSLTLNEHSSKHVQK